MAEADRVALRQKAESALEYGCCSVMQAFNLADVADHGYTFTPEVRAKAEALVKELMFLHFDSAVIPHPRADEGFRGFLARATAKPKRKRKGRQPKAIEGRNG
jgi:hypothetical protein